MGSTPIRSTIFMRIQIKLFLGATALSLLFFIVVLYVAKNENLNPKKVCFQESCFSIEIVDTSEKRAQGLMFRQELSKGDGMLFIFDRQGIYGFWMKNTLIPLDIIWIDEEQRVAFIKENALPCKTDVCEGINPEKEAKYVLELNSGIVESIGLRIGDKFSFEF